MKSQDGGMGRKEGRGRIITKRKFETTYTKWPTITF